MVSAGHLLVTLATLATIMATAIGMTMMTPRQNRITHPLL